MPNTVFTSLSPNLEKDDTVRARKALFSPWTWQKGKAIQRFEQEFKDYLKVKNVTSFESGRTALYTILQALNIQKGDEVLLQAYTCVAVPEPVLWVGATPIYVDCEPERYTLSISKLEKKITPQSKALIIQHTFGNPARMNELLKIAKKHNLFVIEDCAHALGTNYFKKKVGTFGDASFFSFGRDKAISSVFGGMAVAKNKELQEKIAQIQASYPYPTKIWILRQLLHPLLTNLAKKTYASGFGKLILYFNNHLRITSKAVYPEEKKGGKPSFIGHKFPNALAILAHAQLTKINRFNTHRQNLAKLYDQELKSNAKVTRQKLIPGSIYLRYTIQVKNRDQLMRRAKYKGLLLGNWYDTPIAPAGVNYTDIRYARDCETAESLAKTTINLPTDINTTKLQAKQISTFINHETKSVLLEKIAAETKKAAQKN